VFNTLRDAQKKFQLLQQLLSNKSDQSSAYYTKLSIATEEAYVIMNEGMCASTSVCHECADHRDFIRSMLDVLGELEVNAASADNYTDKLTQYKERVNKILTNIDIVLTS
jgi:antirestriction protein ArdC